MISWEIGRFGLDVGCMVLLGAGVGWSCYKCRECREMSHFLGVKENGIPHV
jgi:hypothetical protein